VRHEPQVFRRRQAGAALGRAGNLTSAVGPLRITVTAGDSGSVLALSGEADMTCVAELSAAFAAQVDAAAGHLTVDLAGLRFADSAAIRVLVKASRALRARGGTLTLSRPQPSVARTLSLLGVDRVIPVHGGAGAGTGLDGC
jgi:anti-anti-sigma factor